MPHSQTPPSIRAVIFDLDGVLVSTDECHYRSWQRLADEEGLPFDREFNERFRGVSRMQCLDMLLAASGRRYGDEDRQALADRKNGYYQDMIRDISPADLLPGAGEAIETLRRRGIKVAVASGSKNAPLLLERIGLASRVDAAVSGLDIAHSKPDPEVFLLAAERLATPPERCLVVEDAQSGVEAAGRAGMRALGIGPRPLDGAVRTVRSLAKITVDEMLAL